MYILIAIIVLLIIFIPIFLIRKNKKERTITPLTSIAFAFVVAGIVFNDSRWISYSLMGIGILLSVLDIILKKRRKKN